MILGSRAVVIWPKVLLFRATVGLPLRKLFVRLNASARTSTLFVSLTWKVLDKAASNCQVVGPRTDPTPTLPKLPGAGFLNAAGFKNLTPPSWRYGSPNS